MRHRKQNRSLKLNRRLEILCYDRTCRSELLDMAQVVGTLRVPSLQVPLAAAILALALSPAKFAPAQYPYRVIYPEQRQIEYRDPSAFPPIPLPPTSPPPTVSVPPAGDIRYFPLDDAIRAALANSRVIRILAGVSAVSSGRTIYDTAIASTAIDEQLGRFDPFLRVNNNWDHIDVPSAVTGSTFIGRSRDQYRLDVAVTKENPFGGELAFGVNATRELFGSNLLLPPPLLNPQTTSSAEFGYTQPLLQGFGRPANLAPVVLARIDTERSFFQLKGAVQEQVRGVLEAYWNLVSARTSAWARRRQVEQADFAHRLADARARAQIGPYADAAQARVTLAQFRAQLIAADADVLQQEAALRNLLGLPPWDEAQLIPTSEPTLARVRPNWQELVDLAAARRPDLIELKLILEADEQQLIIANNNALPRLDAVGLYRWNGLEGELPNGNGISTGPGQFTDWTLGVNFSVPLGLRQARASLRQRELILARDQANLEQGLHAASHLLATTVRSLDQTYEQYLAFKEAREAARINLDRQLAEFRSARVNYLSVLVAITDWGNTITSEAEAVAQYNTLLAELELQTGTILETHGVRFYEERYGSIGPLGRLARPVCYPESTPPTPNYDRYPPGDRPAENVFNLEDPTRFRSQPPLENLPTPAPPPR
jgi:outer membrane protein TolC